MPLTLLFENETSLETNFDSTVHQSKTNFWFLIFSIPFFYTKWPGKKGSHWFFFWLNVNEKHTAPAKLISVDCVTEKNSISGHIELLIRWYAKCGCVNCKIFFKQFWQNVTPDTETEVLATLSTNCCSQSVQKSHVRSLEQL